jgi:hypothetical protein
VPLALYMGVHVPRAITDGLRRRSAEVLTAREGGVRVAPESRDIHRKITTKATVLFPK